MQPQVIVCGLGRTGYRIFSVLQQQGIRVVGISESPLDQSEAHPTAHGDNIVVGNLRSEKTLLFAGIREAQTLLLACADDGLNLAILTQARLLNPHIRIINRLFNIQLGERLDRTLPDHISMSVPALVAPIFAFAAIQKPVIGQLNLLGKVWPVTAETIAPNHPWLGCSLRQLWDDPERMLLTYESPRSSDNLMMAIEGGRRLETGDRLILAELPKTRSVQWSFQRRLQNFQRGFRQFRHVGRAIMLVLLALLATIGVAITAYVGSNPNTSLVDALYFSVGMITGAGGQEAVAENSTAWIKVFTAMMMLVGAGVIGICYALLNDFILGTHLQQIWNTTRIPHSGHRIICGLGSIGFSIVDQLLALGEEVVALEANSHNRFLQAAKARQIPVIVGDASVTEMLLMANLEKAEALLAVTSDDATNLEIAITAKSIVPHLPVLVRIHEPKFAQQIQQVFEFDMVLSPTEWTAPAFAAAAIGGRILGDYTAKDGLWLAIAP